MKKKFTIVAVAAIALVAVVFFVMFSGAEESSAITVEAEKGVFDVYVNTTGELQAKNSEEIRGPEKARNFRIWNFKIQEIIPEGTYVKEGDYVATLDRSEITTKMKDIQIDLTKAESQLLQAQLDSAIELREARTNVQNQKYMLEEKKIELAQSKYEPPAIIRKMEIEVQKAEDAYEQGQKSYKLKQQRSQAKVREIAATLQQQQNQLDQLQGIISEFRISAPKDGMLIYRTMWNGSKIGVGSSINAWDPVIATLPDLSSMVSKTYVSEVDISKIKKDQEVVVGIDAFPDLKLPGKVTNVANVGQQLPGGDSKVFEVQIELLRSDSVLRPAMTTGNKILVATKPGVVSVPLETLHSNDSLTYVFARSGGRTRKLQVKVGLTNDSRAEIIRGLEEGATVFLSKPENGDELELVQLKEEEGTMSLKSNK